jgi:hypothetical protein
MSVLEVWLGEGEGSGLDCAGELSKRDCSVRIQLLCSTYIFYETQLTRVLKLESPTPACASSKLPFTLGVNLTQLLSFCKP